MNFNNVIKRYIKEANITTPSGTQILPNAGQVMQRDQRQVNPAIQPEVTNNIKQLQMQIDQLTAENEQLKREKDTLLRTVQSLD